MVTLFLLLLITRFQVYSNNVIIIFPFLLLGGEDDSEIKEYKMRQMIGNFIKTHQYTIKLSPSLHLLELKSEELPQPGPELCFYRQDTQSDYLL